jgi:sphingomyelin phosphodiesterase
VVEAPPELEKGSELKVLSFNAFCRPPGIKNKANDWKTERLVYLAKYEMAKYDIVCFQELFGSLSGRRTTFLKACAPAGHTNYITSPQPSWKFLIDGGLAIVSKYPIVESEWRPFAPGCHSDRLAEKGVLYAKIEISSARNIYVHVFNAHTQSSYNDPVGALSWKIREKQTLAMLDFIQSVTAEDSFPVMVMGDLNIDARKEFPENVSSSEYKAFFQQLQAMKSSRGPFDPHPVGYSVLDLLFHFNRNVHPVTFGDATISDTNVITPLETVFTKAHDYGSFQSLDYIFWLIRPSKANDSEEQDVKTVLNATSNGLTPKSSQVAKMFVQGHPFTQLSDHYGAEAIFTVH